MDGWNRLKNLSQMEEIFRRNDLLEDYRRESDIAGKLFHLM